MAKDRSQDTSAEKVLLIVEDESTLLHALAAKASILGVLILRARNGQEALLLAQENNPDVILLDMLMPTMSGLDFLNHLRVQTWGKNASVIILSNSDDSSDISKAVEDGVYEYYMKANTSINTIIERVKELLNK